MNSDGAPWANSELTDTFLDTTDKNCIVGENETIYVLQNTSCKVHVTFVENQNFAEKTEIIKVKADKKDNSSTVGVSFYKATKDASYSEDGNHPFKMVSLK